MARAAPNPDREILILVFRSHPEWTLAQLVELAGTKTGKLLERLRVCDPWTEVDAEGIVAAARLQGDEFDACVLTVIREAGSQVRAAYLRAHVGGPRWKLQAALGRLAKAGLIDRAKWSDGLDALLVGAVARQLMPHPIDPGRAWFCGRVRAIRLMLGLGQEALAERSGLDANTIRRLELGDFSPSLDTLTKLSQGLGVRRAFLVDTEGPPDADEIRLLVATLHGKAPQVVRLAVRAALAIVSECEVMAIESSGAEAGARDESH